MNLPKDKFCKEFSYNQKEEKAENKKAKKEEKAENKKAKKEDKKENKTAKENKKGGEK